VPASRDSAARQRLRLIHGSGSKSEPANQDGRAKVEDEEILRAFARGDRAGSALLYDRVAGMVDATLYRVMGGRSPDHEDLVQSAFEQIVRTLVRRRFVGACSLAGWAAAVTCNVALNALRSRKREGRVFDRNVELTTQENAAGRINVEREVGVSRSLISLRRALAKMSAEKAETLLLHDMMGHDLAEIAVIMDVSVSAAQTRLSRGRRELRRLLEQEMGNEREGGAG
jgi:RNA polymerase sigma-70 factor (ECF subfamily)